jgi:hypothetical protein
LRSISKFVQLSRRNTKGNSTGGRVEKETGRGKKKMGKRKEQQENKRKEQEKKNRGSRSERGELNVH